MIKPRYEYQKAAAKLRDKILRGVLKPAQRLAPERELCDELGVSRITVRLALDLLEKQNLIRRRQGSGNYVSNHPHASLPIGVDYGSRAGSAGADLNREVALMEWTTGHAAHRECEAFPPGEEVLHLKRIFYAETVPVVWDRGFILRQFSSHLCEKDLCDVDFMNRWMQVENFQAGLLNQTISSVLANREDARILKIKIGVSLVRSFEEVYDDKGKLAGFFPIITTRKKSC